MNGRLARLWARLALGLIPPALLVLWWQAEATGGGARALAFAPLGAILSSFVTLVGNGSLLSDTVATVSRSIAGLLIGGSLGVATGIAMAMWRSLDRVLGPLLHALRQVPLIGWLPLIGLWFGTGQEAELILLCLSAFFPAMLNSHEGVALVEPRYVEVGRVYGFSPAQSFRYVLLPAAMPLILTGLTQALAFAWIAAVATEILLGAGGGLGVAMEAAQVQQRMDVIMATIIVTAIAGFILNHAFVRLRRHLLRWQGAPL